MAGIFWIGRNVLLSTLDLKLRYPRGVRAQRVIDPVVDSPYALFGELGFLGIGNRDNSIRELPSATLPNDFKICPSRYHLRGVLRYGGFRRIQAKPLWTPRLY